MQAGPGSAKRRNWRFVGFKVAIVVALFGAAALAPEASSLAGKGGGDPWIQLGSSGARAAAPSLGNDVHFNTGNVPRTVKNPRIEVLCYQGDTLVFGMAGGLDYDFLLGGGGSLWKDRGGDASCDANLFYFGWKNGEQTYNRL